MSKANWIGLSLIGTELVLVLIAVFWHIRREIIDGYHKRFARHASNNCQKG